MTRNALLIGSFVIAALAIVLVSVLWLSGGNFLNPQLKALVYYEGNVTGLSVGAPVTFRGVRVGEVTDIRILMNTTTLKAIIPVSIKLQPSSLYFQDGDLSRRPTIRSLVQHGLRARLDLLSVLTSQKKIELDFLPNTPVVLVGSPDEPEIPAVKERFSALMDQISELPLRDTVAEIRGTLREFRTTLVAAQHTLNGAQTALAGVAKEVRLTGAESRRTLTTATTAIRQVQDRSTAALDSITRLADASHETVLAAQPELQRTLTSAREAAETAKAAIDQVSGLAPPDTPQSENLAAAIKDLSEAARNLRSLSEMLEEQPNAVLFGRKRE